MKFEDLEAENGTYRVYEDGTIESNVKRARKTVWYEKKHMINDKGYHRIYLSLKDEPPKTVMVHRVVAKLFLEPPKDSSRIFINHKDGNKDNNHYSNLEWCTHAENILHAKILGLMGRDKDTNGRPVRVTFEFPTARTAERFFGLGPDVIARWARGNTSGSRTHPIVDVHYIE